MFSNSANTTLHLLSIVNKSDALGIRCPTIITNKKVIGCLKSITLNEYQTSVMMNLKIEYKIVLQGFLYEGQKFALINNVVYKVERTFQNGQFIELYLALSDYKIEDFEDVNVSGSKHS